jgi:hypothetical protein
MLTILSIFPLVPTKPSKWKVLTMLLFQILCLAVAFSLAL